MQKCTDLGAQSLAEGWLTRDDVRQLLCDGEDAMRRRRVGLGRDNAPALRPGRRALRSNRDVRLLRTGVPQAGRGHAPHGHMYNDGYAAATMFKSSVGGGVFVFEL